MAAEQPIPIIRKSISEVFEMLERQERREKIHNNHNSRVTSDNLLNTVAIPEIRLEQLNLLKGGI